MDRKIQAAVELRQARRGDLTRPPSNQSEIDNIARTERGEGRFVIHIGGFPTCTHFRAVGHSTLRLKGCRPRVAIFNSMPSLHFPRTYFCMFARDEEEDKKDGRTDVRAMK